MNMKGVYINHKGMYVNLKDVYMNLKGVYMKDLYINFNCTIDKDRHLANLSLETSISRGNGVHTVHILQVLFTITKY